ncbi:MAG: Hsp70 family protein [Polyangiales bacterium]
MTRQLTHARHMQSHFHPQCYAIDFGTTNSLLAAASIDGVHAPIALDPLAKDPSILRSVLYFPDATHCHYGADALAQYVAHGMQGRLMRSVKKFLPSRSFVGTHVEERPMNLEDLIGALLGEMRARANRFFDADVTAVVLGRPARFSTDDGDDRYAEYRLERAARIAGFREVSFCAEPIAAARDFRNTLAEPRTVLVGDFGGGTSDFTVMRMRAGDYDPTDVLAIGGVSVAGDAFDAAIMRHHVARHFGSEVRYRVPMGHNVLTMPTSLSEKLCSPADASLLRSQDALSFLRNVRDWSLGEDDRRVMDQLFTFVEDRLGFAVFEAIESAKRTLSEANLACVQFSYPTIEVSEPIERVAFEQSSQSKTAAIVAELDATLARARLEPASIDIVCCTGGTARLPALSNALALRFGRKKLTEFRSFHSVIHGLAEHAHARLRGEA